MYNSLTNRTQRINATKNAFANENYAGIGAFLARAKEMGAEPIEQTSIVRYMRQGNLSLMNLGNVGRDSRPMVLLSPF